MIVAGFDFDKGYVVAKQRAQEMVESGLYSRFSLSKEQRIEKAAVGCLGEIAFAHWLDINGIQYELDLNGFEGRQSDDFDFRIDGKLIDVKVAKLSSSNPPQDGWRFGVPRNQNPGMKDYLVIGWVDFKKKEVGFYGWIEGRRVAQMLVVEENSLTSAPYLTPNHEFRWGELSKDLREIV